MFSKLGIWKKRRFPRVPLDADQTKKKRRHRARVMMKARVVRGMWKVELERYSEFSIPIDNVFYADDSFDVEHALRAVDDVNNVGKDVLVGFNTEGSIKVLQLFFNFGNSSYTIVFQLTRHQRNGNAFSCIRTSSSREKR